MLSQSSCPSTHATRPSRGRVPSAGSRILPVDPPGTWPYKCDPLTRQSAPPAIMPIHPVLCQSSTNYVLEGRDRPHSSGMPTISPPPTSNMTGEWPGGTPRVRACFLGYEKQGGWEPCWRIRIRHRRDPSTGCPAACCEEKWSGLSRTWETIWTSHTPSTISSQCQR